MNLIFVLLVLLIVKMVGNCVTVGTGLSAGFTGPIIIVGMLIGVIFSTIAGIEYYTSEFYALICAGFTGMLASSMNIPIAAMILSVELFGYNYVIIGILTTIIAFKINDYNTLFEY
jgi:CIC family chloride channel protein